MSTRVPSSSSTPTVVVVDPGIKVDKGYAAWDNGLKDGVFVRVREWGVFESFS